MPCLNDSANSGGKFCCSALAMSMISPSTLSFRATAKKEAFTSRNPSATCSS